MFSSYVFPNHVEDERAKYTHGAVEHHRHTLTMALMKCPGQDGGHERKERCVHQQEGIEKEQSPIGGRYVVEHGMVIGPNLSNKQKTDEVGHVGRPQDRQAAGQVLGVGRWSDSQYEQCDRYSEDSVAEGDKAFSFPYRLNGRHLAGTPAEVDSFVQRSISTRSATNDLRSLRHVPNSPLGGSVAMSFVSGWCDSIYAA